MFQSAGALQRTGRLKKQRRSISMLVNSLHTYYLKIHGDREEKCYDIDEGTFLKLCTDVNTCKELFASCAPNILAHICIYTSGTSYLLLFIVLAYIPKRIFEDNPSLSKYLRIQDATLARNISSLEQEHYTAFNMPFLSGTELTILVLSQLSEIDATRFIFPKDDFLELEIVSTESFLYVLLHVMRMRSNQVDISGLRNVSVHQIFSLLVTNPAHLFILTDYIVALHSSLFDSYVPQIVTLLLKLKESNSFYKLPVFLLFLLQSESELTEYIVSLKPSFEELFFSKEECSNPTSHGFLALLLFEIWKQHKEYDAPTRKEIVNGLLILNGLSLEGVDVSGAISTLLSFKTPPMSPVILSVKSK
ncbi:hypothetical protein PCE1_001258 [Barthelona sp. PCE]